MSNKLPTYLSYLVRLWQEDVDDVPHRSYETPRPNEEKPIWRASLENPVTGERNTFASLDDLFKFLQGSTGTAPDAQDKEPATKL